jgi:spore maturation protein CgeB
MRTFEIPGSGGLMLARYTKAQAEMFPEDEAAIYYRSPQELNGKIDCVLRDREHRARIRRNARRIAMDQTYDRRAAAVLRECGVATPTRLNP